MASPQKSDPSVDAGKAGDEIRFLLGESSLGLTLVASSRKGLVSILMGEDEELLIEDLQRRFPEAQLVRGDARQRVLLDREAAAAERERPMPDTLDR